MNKGVKIGVAIVVIIVVGIAAVFFMTSGMEKTADAFFTAVRQSDLTKARSYLSEDFRNSTDDNALKEFLSNSAILNFRSASWSNRQISGNRGQLDGVITTDSGGAVPLKLTFVKEMGDWKIYALQKPAAGLQSGDASLAVPRPGEQMALVKQSMHDFLVSVERKDMSHFWSTISKMWQKQVTAGQLNAAFSSIIDSGANWSAIDALDPSLTSAAGIDEEGVLTITGQYATTPVLNFGMKYVYEGVGWKLIGFSLEAK